MAAPRASDSPLGARRSEPVPRRRVNISRSTRPKTPNLGLIHPYGLCYMEMCRSWSSGLVVHAKFGGSIFETGLQRLRRGGSSLVDGAAWCSSYKPCAIARNGGSINLTKGSRLEHRMWVLLAAGRCNWPPRATGCPSPSGRLGVQVLEIETYKPQTSRVVIIHLGVF